MKTNYRGDPANMCWMCGGTNTKPLDSVTRECNQCGNWYTVYDDHPEEEHAPDQEAPGQHLE
jgi:hypothetical protein